MELMSRVALLSHQLDGMFDCCAQPSSGGDTHAFADLLQARYQPPSSARDHSDRIRHHAADDPVTASSRGPADEPDVESQDLSGRARVDRTHAVPVNAEVEPSEELQDSEQETLQESVNGSVSESFDAAAVSTTGQGAAEVEQSVSGLSVDTLPSDLTLSVELSTDTPLAVPLSTDDSLEIVTDAVLTEAQEESLDVFGSGFSPVDDSLVELPVWVAQALSPASPGSLALSALPVASDDSTSPASALTALSAWTDSLLGSADTSETALSEKSTQAQGQLGQERKLAAPLTLMPTMQNLLTAGQSSTAQAGEAVDSTRLATVSDALASGGAVPLDRVGQVAAAHRAQPLLSPQSLMQAGVMAERLSAQILWMQSHHLQRAEMKLNPAELGPLNIQLDIQRDQASVAVSAQHAQVREWLDAGQWRLRELLGQSGLQLQQYSVFEQSTQSSADGQRGSGHHGGSAEAHSAEHDLEGNMDIEPVRVGLGLVDSYV